MKNNDFIIPLDLTTREHAFPGRCPHCGKSAVVPSTIPYDAEVRYDGRLYPFTIPQLQIPICQACGEKVFTEEVDAQVNAALRSHLCLLAPHEMRAALARIGVTQKEVSERSGVAEATLSLWLNDCQIQSRAMDNLLRVFFAFPEVRSALADNAQDSRLGLVDISVQRQPRESPRANDTHASSG